MSKRIYLTPQSYWDLPDSTDLDALQAQIAAAMGAGSGAVEIPVVHDWVPGTLLLNAAQSSGVVLLDNDPIAESRIAH